MWNWFTYPLTCFIESIFQQAQTANSNSKNDPLLVEICSVAERALNYMHTGNAAVIATSVMNPLWTGLAIIQDGQPCFNPKYVVTAHGSRVQILPEYWPYNKKRHQPLSSSKRSQLLTYGDSHYHVSAHHHFHPFMIFRCHISWIKVRRSRMSEWRISWTFTYTFCYCDTEVRRSKQVDRRIVLRSWW